MHYHVRDLFATLLGRKDAPVSDSAAKPDQNASQTRPSMVAAGGVTVGDPVVLEPDVTTPPAPADALLTAVTDALATFKTQVVDPLVAQVKAAVEEHVPAVEAKIRELDAKVEAFFAKHPEVEAVAEEAKPAAESLLHDAEAGFEHLLGLEPQPTAPEEGAPANTQPSV